MGRGNRRTWSVGECLRLGIWGGVFGWVMEGGRMRPRFLLPRFGLVSGSTLRVNALEAGRIKGKGSVTDLLDLRRSLYP